ncbi:MAG: pantoate--beta-alanine ligase [Corynebacterium sp.]|uniref:pantoate--beta-alanine ligase n=1 Tax=Corynebacterium sp. TaxID=1720 RepID=UPI0026DC2A89|nr:pantoate--beta-alanine ligase [Corynebacterium sp.]MDO5098406.1 pantoate--beta-alanine ligase [Corynebacterium sp.]
MTQVLHTIEEVKTLSRNTTGPIVVVPTMGALHNGHLSLVAHAQKIPNATVIVSIFVNPLQFAAGEDLDAYPRTLDKDVEKLETAGVPYVFAPTANEMYAAGPRTVIHPGPAGAILEGKTRPTHFAGVLTVVHKLFQITGATHAVFGEKDYQQLLLIKQMVADLNLDITIIAAPTVRETTGLALSSRNQYLSEHQAQLATALYQALCAGAQHDTAAAVQRAVTDTLTAHPEIAVDYVAVTSPELAEPVSGENRLLIAARVGETRLIDNIEIVLT